MSIQWINYEGVKVLYTDCRLKSPRQLKDLFHEYTDYFQTIKDERVYRIINFEGVPISREMVNMGKLIGKQMFSKKPGITVFVGISGIKRLYANVYSLYSGYDIVFKDNLDDALTYIYNRVPKNNTINKGYTEII